MGLFGFDVITALIRVGSGADLYASSRAGIIADERLSVGHDGDDGLTRAGIILASAWNREYGP